MEQLCLRMTDYQNLDIHYRFVLYSALPQGNTSSFNMLECHAINETSETPHEPFSLVLSRRLNSIMLEQGNSCMLDGPHQSVVLTALFS